MPKLIPPIAASWASRLAHDIAVRAGRVAVGLRAGLALGLVLLWPLGGQAQVQALRFAEPAAIAAPGIGTQLLSAEERAYIAQLPEVRVAIPQPLSRPYQTLGPDGMVGGIHSDMLVSLAKAFGLRLKPVSMPTWSATLEAVRKREVDLLMTVGVTSERTEYLAFSLGATPSPAALFARKPGAASAAAATAPLASATYVLEADFLANDFVRRQYPQARIVSVQTTGEALAAVAQGKADYYLGSLLEAAEWLAREPQPQVHVQQLLNHGTGYYHFAVRKDWAPLATILNKGISALRASAPPQLAEALASLSDRIVLPPPVVLGPAEAARLIEKPVWRLGAVRGLAMLNEYTPDGQHSGIGAEYAEQVAQQLGIGLQVLPFENVAAMLQALRDGRIDLVPFLTRTPERAREFSFSAPYVSMPYMVVARSDAPLYWNLDSLRGRRLALAGAHPLRELLAQQYPDIEIVTTVNGNAAMDAVAEGRADAAVEVKLFANLRINGDNDGKLRAVAEVAELPAQFHFAAARSGANLIPIVDRALQQIPNHERERILRRWVALDLRPAFPWQRYAPLMGLAGAMLLMLMAATWFWMRRLQREVVQRRRSEERLAAIGATLPCVAFRYLLDGAHALQGGAYYSQGAAELLGQALDPAATLIDNLAPRLRPEHLNAARRLEQASLASGERLRFIAAYAHPDGRERWLHVEAVAKASQLQSETGLTAWTGYVVDITAERELQDRVEREAQARNLMLASASHELRAPTHTLSLALQSLTDPAAGMGRPDALRTAQDAVRTLGQLLNDVLDAARLDRGELHLRPQMFSPRELIEQVRLEAQAWAQSKGLVFAAEVEAGVPDTVQLDPLRLRQILSNLLSNAIKYTHAGHVGLRLGLLPSAAGAPARPPSLLFEVRDSGPGIAPERHAHLFSPYAAADPAAMPVPEGSSGLGLNISRRLANLMGGQVTLSSEPGKGTVVRLLVPLPGATRLPPAGPAAAPGSIILCEDDPTCLLLMGQMLRGHGYPVIECSNALQALEVWRAGGVHAIVTDLYMEGMDGITLVQRVRSESGERAVALLVCSGNPVPAQQPGQAPPYDAWLTKPVQMNVLLGTLASLGVHPPSAPAPRESAGAAGGD